MAAILSAAPSTQHDASTQSPVALVAGLVALVTGVAVFLVGAMLPDLGPRPTEGSAGGTAGAAEDQFSAAQDSTPTTGDRHHLIAAVNPTFVDHLGAERAGSMHAKSAHLATCPPQLLSDRCSAVERCGRLTDPTLAKSGPVPVEPSSARWDLREDLAQMAAAQYTFPHVDRCADSDPFLMSGRIAAAQNALFGPPIPTTCTTLGR